MKKFLVYTFLVGTITGIIPALVVVLTEIIF